jgi:hypothetical protein
MILNSRSQILMVVASLVLIITVWQLIKRDKLRPAYGLLWLITSGMFFFFVVFKKLGTHIANFFFVEYAPSFFFALAIFFIVSLLMFTTTVLSAHAKKTTELAERVALLQWRVEQLEEQVRQASLLEIPSPPTEVPRTDLEPQALDNSFVTITQMKEESIL